jgi:hypothetical protein
MISGQVGVKISATAPATVGATMVLWQAGGNERGRVRLELHTDFHLHYIVTWQNGGDSTNPATDLDLGLLTASTPFVVEAQAGVDTFSASLNGGTRIYAPVGQMPGLAQMWIGRSFTGETWTGTIERVSVFKQAHSAAPYLVIYGDSQVQNSRGSYLGPNTIAPAVGYWNGALAAALSPPRRLVAKGYPGFGAAAILDKFLNTDPVQSAGGWNDPNTIYGIWAGYNDQSNILTALPPVLNSMVGPGAPLNGKKYFIMNINNGEAAAQYVGGAIGNAFLTMNTQLLTNYGDGLTLGGHVVQNRELLMASSTHTGQDAIDDSHGITPVSTREDLIHFNGTKGGPIDMAAAKAVIEAQGWSPTAPN